MIDIVHITPDFGRKLMELVAAGVPRASKQKHRREIPPREQPAAGITCRNDAGETIPAYGVMRSRAW